MKRSLSLLLALVMCLSLVNISAFAAGYEDQVMDGYFVVGSDGVTETTENATNSDQGYTVSKTIDQTGENAFDITLKVETQQTVQTNDAAVILVIDVSGSMKSCAECGGYSDNWGYYYHGSNCPGHRYGETVAYKDSRMAATISAAKNFVKSLKDNNSEGGNLYVSVVKFSTNAYKVCDWIDISEGNNISTVNRAIDRLEADGGTNLDAGLTLAYNRLGMNDVSSASNKYTVLLTDGEPTYYYSGNSTSTDKIEGSRGGGGSSASENTVNHAIDAANNVKSRSTLYTICFGVEDDVCLEGQTIHVCAHCEESRDKHVRVELCANCGQPKSDHPRGDWGIRWCPTGDWNSWDGKTYYFCDETRKTQYEDKTITNGDLTVGSFLSGSIATSPDHAYNAKNTAALNEAFKDIADSASEGNTGAGTQVIDPMGQYITFGQVKSVTGGTANFANNTLTWTLDPKDAQTSSKDGTTTYTFTLTYSITLDTAAEGFQETEEVDGEDVTKYYPTNGYTSLKVPGKNDVVFNVPGVCGTIPEYAYRVEYYLQSKTDPETYELKDTVNGDKTDLHTSVTILEDGKVPANILDKYNGQNYHFEKAEPATIAISANEENNVIKVYYNRDTTDVTVNHYYKTTTIHEDGTTTEGVYPEQPNVQTTGSGYVGDSYTAELQTNYGGASYEFDSLISDQQTITLRKDGTNNVIDLYYQRTVDNRAAASVVVNHVYRTHTWTLTGGKYVLVTTEQTEQAVETANDLKATTLYTAKTDPTGGYEDYDYDTESKNSIILEPGENTITLYFDKTVDNRQSIEITVNHHYTKTVVSINDDGEVVTTVDPDDKVVTSTVSAYKGETVTLTEELVYNGETYMSDSSNAGKLIVSNAQGGETVDLYYSIYQAPVTTSVTVNHIYRTITHETVEVIDPETGE